MRHVLVMDYGTPSSPEAVESYYTHIRRGRPPTPELLEDLRRRYRAIGGVSPLAERGEAQRARLQAALDERAPGGWQVVVAHKHAPPFIEDAVTELARAGATSIVGLVLAPHFSRASVGEYLARLEGAAAALSVASVGIHSWFDQPAWLDFQAAAVKEALAALPRATKVLFTAHSLPERVLEGDPYPDQLHASATAIARRAGLEPWSGWGLAWQSAGRTPDPWRGPDILDVIDAMAATGRAEGVAVCPQGFTADHLEVLYDLDIEAHQRAAAAGLAFARTRSLNDDPVVFAELAGRVVQAGDGLSDGPA